MTVDKMLRNVRVSTQKNIDALMVASKDPDLNIGMVKTLNDLVTSLKEFNVAVNNAIGD
jgi:hypothetical protein